MQGILINNRALYIYSESRWHDAQVRLLIKDAIDKQPNDVDGYLAKYKIKRVSFNNFAYNPTP